MNEFNRFFCEVDHFLDATDVEASNAYLMQQMTSEEFEQLLHPAFQEDEWILILVQAMDLDTN